ncbi:hypothetical protein V5799_025580 [Amblyomma americanum]|uniref:Uncharacterized protein n=1 Tax=Amblyomma americanum TaxID=6943 RepID=A0AAQ4E8W2_AMBAM
MTAVEKHLRLCAAGMQPAPRQLVALASHHEAAKRHPDAVQPQPANGVQLLKTSMGATLVGPAGQPSLFSVAGIPSPAGSMVSAAMLGFGRMCTLCAG